MKKRSKLILSAIALTGILGSVTGCQKDTFKGLTIHFWHTFGQTVLGGLETCARDYAKIIKETEGVDLRIKFTYKGGYSDVLGEVGKSFGAGGNPTITVAYPDHVADYFASEGDRPGRYVVDLQPYAESTEYGFGTEEALGDKYGIEDFVSGFIAESKNYYKKGMYSIPFLKSTEVMLYNEDLVRKAIKVIDGRDLTTSEEIREELESYSWEEFMDFCELVKEKKNEISPALEYPCIYDSDGNLFITQLYQRGIPFASLGSAPNSGIIDFDGRNENATESQKQAYKDVQDLLKKYQDWHKKGLFTTKGVTGQYSSYYFEPQHAMFAIGSCGGSGYSFPKNNEFTVGCIKVPYSNNNPVYVSQGPTLTVLHNSKLQQSGKDDEAVLYAWKFIKYITNEEINAKQCTLNSEGYIPVRESAYSTSTFTRYLSSSTAYVVVTKMVVNDIAGSYFSTPVFKGSASLREQCEGILADVLKAKESIKTILDRGLEQASGLM